MASYSDKIYGMIYQDIVTAVLQPGQRLHIADLAKTYDVGLSPVRDALAKLTATDLVVAYSQKGFRVAAVSIEDLRDLYATRTAVEIAALKLAIEKGDIDWEAELMAASHRLSQYEKKNVIRNLEGYKEWEEYHREFTRTLLSACGLNYLMKIWEKLFVQTERYRRIWFLAGFQKGKTLHYSERQKKIMQAALKRDFRKASDLLNKHFELAEKEIEQYLARLQKV